jgi:Cu(I)-responsive transcriptional regulator
VALAQPQSPQLQHWQSTQVQGAQAQQPHAAGAEDGIESLVLDMANLVLEGSGQSPQDQGSGLPQGQGQQVDNRAMAKPLRPELAQAREQGFHNIGEASAATGVSARMIREYERDGLIPAAQRTFAGYRLYNDADLHRLHFIKRARNLGFPMKQVELLLNLWNDRDRSSADVKALAAKHAEGLRGRITEMQAMQKTLEDLARQCHGDGRPECPILEGLSATKSL